MVAEPADPPGLRPRSSASARFPVLRELEAGDLDAVAGVHIAAFPEAVLTRLGRPTVHGYYDWLLGGPHDAHRIGAFDGPRLLGFCFGGRFHGSLTGYLRGRPLRLAASLVTHPAAAASALRRFGPGTLSRLAWRAARFRRKAAVAWSPPRPAESSFGILAIAVDPAAQGRGVGGALMERAEAEALRRGYRWMHLTVHPENRTAVGFYERLGWSRMGGPPWEGRMARRIAE